MARKYEQRLRAESAEETKQRILDALHERLRQEPTRPVSVEEIARLARVSRSTVYVVFGSRTGLFDALSNHLLTGAGYDQLITAVRHPDGREHLRGALEGGVHMYAAQRDAFRVLFSLAQLDPAAVGGTVHRNEEMRRRGIERLARKLRDQHLLRQGVTAGDAANVIWLLAGFDAFDSLYTGRGLAPDDIARSLIATAESALF
jgi:AcrR family transcriptional regulator